MPHRAPDRIPDVSTKVFRRRAGSAGKLLRVRPRVSMPKAQTTRAATPKQRAPRVNTPPWPVSGRASPVTSGPSSEPIRPTAEAKPEPVARAEVG